MKNLATLLTLISLTSFASASTRIYDVRCISEHAERTGITDLGHQQLVVETSDRETTLTVGEHTITVSGDMDGQISGAGRIYRYVQLNSDMSSKLLQMEMARKSIVIVTRASSDVQEKAISCDGREIPALISSMNGLSEQDAGSSRVGESSSARRSGPVDSDSTLGSYTSDIDYLRTHPRQ